MAATGFTPIQLYRTSTTGTSPTAGNLTAGELAINYNTADMSVWALNTGGSVIRLMNNPAGLKYPTTDGTANQVIKTDGAGNLTFVTPATGTVTSVSGTGTVSGLTLSGTVTSSGSLTLGGSITGFLPTAGGTMTGAITFAAGQSFTGTLPLAGGTMTGAITFAAGQTVDGTNGIGYINIPQNSQSAAYTLVAADAGKHIFHPSTDANARTFTIPANSSVAYPIGTAISFVNMTSQVVSIAITTDTMYLAGTGTTGTRSLAQYGTATALKMTSTTWIISGAGLT
jgi:hypothetical protein